MNKLYNTESNIAKDLQDFFQNLDFNLHKPQAKMLPHLLTSIINAENITTLDISKIYIDDSLLTNNSSIQKKIWRFLNTSRFNGTSFYNLVIKKVISKISSLKHQKLVVTIDHMYTSGRFVTLMFSLKVGNGSIPLWFSSDKTRPYKLSQKDFDNQKCLFTPNVIFNAVREVADLLKPINAKITFLADRWFFNLNLMKLIQDLGHFFCIRARVNSSIRFLIYDFKEKHHIYKHFSDLSIQKHHAKYYENIPFGKLGFVCNLSISRNIISDDEPWFILSNIPPNQALREYSHRFGAIETLFKNQKSNGFNLEKTHTRNLHAFENLYSLVCFACTWLSIIGEDYIKNFNNVKNKLYIRFIKMLNKKKIKILSSFNLGLTIFKRCYSSYINYKIKCNMKLYL